ncbi:MAG: ribonuclease P protein component [Actinomycetaceae bacterium]|nr:ribonuclease P protein component [Actinomycetaceae bacterium]
MLETDDFKAVTRRGAHAGTASLTVHYLADKTDDRKVAALVGFVVPKREIARSSRRNRVKRRLRHVMFGYLGKLGHGSRTVVRAKSMSSTMSSKDLETELLSALNRAMRKEHQS